MLFSLHPKNLFYYTNNFDSSTQESTTTKSDLDLLLRSVTFCAKTNSSFIARAGWRKNEAECFFHHQLFTLFNTNTIPSVLRLFCVRIFSFFSLFCRSQKAFSVYPTRQNIFIPDIFQLANHGGVVLCCYGDNVPEKERTTNAHAYNRKQARGEWKSRGMETRVRGWKEKNPTIQQ